MESEDSLESDLEILESLSLTESFINANTPPVKYSSAPEEKPKPENNRYLDTSRVYLSPYFDLSDHSESDQPSTSREPEEYKPCTNSSCSSKIMELENKINLLQVQNSQLVANSCALYNTLIKHIESIREEMKKKDEIIKYM